MKRHLFGAVASVSAILLIAGCVEDPTAALRGDVDRVVISRTYIELDVGGTIRLFARAFDAQGNVLPTLPTISVADGSVATATVDETTSGDPQPQTDFDLAAVGAGSTTITATVGGVTSDPTTLVSFPTSFGGAVAVSSSALGFDIVTVTATSSIKFDPAATTATIGGAAAYVHSVTADQLELVASQPNGATGATVSLTNLVFLDEFPTTLDATTPVTTAAPNFMTDDITTAPDISAGPFPLTFYGVVSGSAPDAIVKVSPAAGLTLSTSVDWIDHDTDIDVFYTDASDGFVDCLGCGSSIPETGSWTVTGGDTNYFYVELYSGSTTVFQVKITSP
ncbi:MAG: hypothetical protein OER90_10945 [Gemmatimonadota bacterium]|nr:hypothetical protein [Gemmatimonadota bacterium]